MAVDLDGDVMAYFYEKHARGLLKTARRRFANTNIWKDQQCVAEVERWMQCAAAQLVWASVTQDKKVLSRIANALAPTLQALAIAHNAAWLSGWVAGITFETKRLNPGRQSRRSDPHAWDAGYTVGRYRMTSAVQRDETIREIQAALLYEMYSHAPQQILPPADDHAELAV